MRFAFAFSLLGYEAQFVLEPDEPVEECLDVTSDVEVADGEVVARFPIGFAPAPHRRPPSGL